MLKKVLLMLFTLSVLVVNSGCMIPTTKGYGYDPDEVYYEQKEEKGERVKKSLNSDFIELENIRVKKNGNTVKITGEMMTGYKSQVVKKQWTEVTSFEYSCTDDILYELFASCSCPGTTMVSVVYYYIKKPYENPKSNLFPLVFIPGVGLEGYAYQAVKTRKDEKEVVVREEVVKDKKNAFRNVQIAILDSEKKILFSKYINSGDSVKLDLFDFLQETEHDSRNLYLTFQFGYGDNLIKKKYNKEVTFSMYDIFMREHKKLDKELSKAIYSGALNQYTQETNKLRIKLNHLKIENINSKNIKDLIFNYNSLSAEIAELNQRMIDLCENINSEKERLVLDIDKCKKSLAIAEERKMPEVKKYSLELAQLVKLEEKGYDSVRSVHIDQQTVQLLTKKIKDAILRLK